MMIKNLKKSLQMGIFLFSLLSILAGCEQPEEFNSDRIVTGGNSPGMDQLSKRGATVGFNLDFKALRSQVLAQQSSRSIKTTQLISGSLIAKNQNTNQSESFNWTISLNDENWQVESLKTVVLTPAPYQFSFLLSEGDQQYAGIAIATIQDGTNDVPITIRPVIGDTITNVSVVSELANFKFQYSSFDLSRFTTPKIGISIDGAAEQIYNLNKTTGLQIENQYINLTAGQRTIKLNLYDGAMLVGKSAPEQEIQIITPGENVTIDLIAFQGETTFALTTEGNSGKFDFKIPTAVIDEAGGKENLSVKFSISGSKIPLQENILSLGNISGDSYPATITLPNLYYDQVTLSLEFLDLQKSSEKFGNCTVEVTLSTIQNSLNCPITLHRRAVVSGDILSVVGVRVIDEAKVPSEGTTLKIGDTALGLTGSGSFGMPGYLKLFLKAGKYRIEAFKGNLYGFADVSPDALNIKNLEITLTSYNSCKAIKTSYYNAESGIYTIDPDGTAGANVPFQAYCDMETDGGGWTVIQRRQDGSVDFYRDWNSYKAGFGSLSGEHWLGNDNIHLLTNTVTSELRIDMKGILPATGLEETAYAHYSTFRIADESDKYRLTVAGFSDHAGNPGDSLDHSDAGAKQNGKQFTTKDQDNDLSTADNCAVFYTGAWWFDKCYRSHLNGVYGTTGYGENIHWYTFNGFNESLNFVEMKVR